MPPPSKAPIRMIFSAVGALELAGGALLAGGVLPLAAADGDWLALGLQATARAALVPPKTAALSTERRLTRRCVSGSVVSSSSTTDRGASVPSKAVTDRS